jgi:hypothetical protein|tara:strand:- start:4522 stop:5376 length:855 start_codon:yes stop_codon:yes gene_type:complete
MANTKGTTSWSSKWLSSLLQQTLKAALVAEKVCRVDRGNNYTIWNPYGNAPTTTVQALTGTYSISNWTSTNDTLTVTDEFILAEHIFDFERVMQHVDITKSRQMEMMASVVTAIDKFVLNNLCEDGTGTYSTPAGGFSQANIPIIISNLISKTQGYANDYKGLYLVLEAQDTPGFMQAGAGQGFAFADAWLNNGFMGQYMGVDIYVKPNSTFTDETMGTVTWTNSGHRVFGVKGVATYASPRDVQTEIKSVTLKTGKELVMYGYIGFKQWNSTAALTVDVTVTA